MKYKQYSNRKISDFKVGDKVFQCIIVNWLDFEGEIIKVGRDYLIVRFPGIKLNCHFFPEEIDFATKQDENKMKIRFAKTNE